jgi:hypothetical protein
MFPHRNIHKTSPDGRTHNQIDHILKLVTKNTKFHRNLSSDLGGKTCRMAVFHIAHSRYAPHAKETHKVVF